MDEDKGNKDGETILDRIAAIPFEEWDDMPAHEFTSKQKMFKKVVDCPEMPTTLVIAEMGDFIRSEEFAEKRVEFASMLYEYADESIKPRTISSGYASFYAILWKLHQIFENVWSEMDYSWQGLLDWAEKVHGPFLKKQHQEKDHSKNSIRRYVCDLLTFMVDWSILEVRKVLKICETSKLKNDQKYCLAFHASTRFVDFREMGGTSLKDLKMHTNAVGGAWGEDTWAALVRDEYDAAFETPEEEEAGLEDTKPKRALLIPIGVFTSSHIIKIAKMTGQVEDYKKFGVDEETPSGVESVSGVESLGGSQDIRNSTQNTGSSLNLMLSDVSNIEHQGGDDNEGIVFDELRSVSAENFVEESRDEDLEDELDGVDGSVAEQEYTGQEYNENTILCSDDDMDEINFTAVAEKPNLRKPMKAKTNSSKNITVIERAEKSFFVCQCGFSATSLSGSSRHKCKKSVDVSFPCKECGMVCRNPGSLKRHISSKHASSASVVIAPSESSHSKDAQKSKSLPVLTSSRGFPCSICSKTLKSQKNLDAHLLKVHVSTDSVNSSTNPLTEVHGSISADVPKSGSTANKFQCDICMKVLASQKNLDNHVNRVHAETSSVPGQECSPPRSTRQDDGSSLDPATQDSVTPPPAVSSQAESSPPLLTSSTTSSQPMGSINGPKKSCDICGKILANSRNLLNHLKKVHGQVC